ncbi:hypothetical protein GCM10009849_11950 [Sinomonas flava]|uniref:Uncharacterized protein n=1 Tax=Sinomonas flava TaxID=496857 RepID=A0ABP5NKD3_9MICC
MLNRDSANKDAGNPQSAQPALEVHLFGVHEESFIEPAQCSNLFRWKKHYGAHDPVHTDSDTIDTTRVMAHGFMKGTQVAITGEGGEPFYELMLHGREMPANPLWAAVRAVHLRAHHGRHPRLRGSEKIVNECSPHLNVAVEYECVFRIDQRQARVYSGPEATVRPTLNKLHSLRLGESNGRRIVTNDDLSQCITSLVLQAAHKGHCRFDITVMRNYRRHARLTQPKAPKQ